MLKQLIVVSAFVLFAIVPSYAGILPFGINGQYQLKVGDISDIAGTEVTGTEHSILLNREIPIGKFGIISATPYLKGSLSLEEFANDEVVREATLGVDFLVYQNDKISVSVGGASQRIYYGKDVDKTRGYANVKVSF